MLLTFSLPPVLPFLLLPSYDIMPTNWMPTQPAIFSAAQGGVEGLQYGYVRVSANATRLKYQVWQAAGWCTVCGRGAGAGAGLVGAGSCRGGRRGRESRLPLAASGGERLEAPAQGRAPARQPHQQRHVHRCAGAAVHVQGVNAYTGAVMDTVLLTKPAGWQPKSVTARRAERAALPGGVAPNGTSLSILEDLLTLSTLQYVMSNIRTFVQQTTQYFYSGAEVPAGVPPCSLPASSAVAPLTRCRPITRVLFTCLVRLRLPHSSPSTITSAPPPRRRPPGRLQDVQGPVGPRRRHLHPAVLSALCAQPHELPAGAAPPCMRSGMACVCV